MTREEHGSKKKSPNHPFRKMASLSRETQKYINGVSGTVGLMDTKHSYNNHDEQMWFDPIFDFVMGE